MCFLFKKLFRTAVVGAALTAAVVGGTAMVVGPDRVGAMFDQVSTDVKARFDANLDDPVVLKRRLQHVSEKYPEQIAIVRADLQDLRAEMERLEQERRISDRVVELIDEDLAQLVPAVERAADAGGARLAAVSFDGEVMSARRARIRATEIQRERSARARTAEDAAHNLELLGAQEQHFVEYLEKLEADEAELNAKIAQLTGEIENVARTDRLIEMLEEREATLRSCERFEIESLDGLYAAIERKRIEQEARLDRLTAGAELKSYEQMAAEDIAAEAIADEIAQGR